MVGAAATPTPMVSTPKLVASDDSQTFANGYLYWSTMGMLQYLCITKPDLSFCINKLSQAVKRVLRYLIGTMEHGLLLSQEQFKLVCYSDVDWASSIKDR
ncbi:hypothetical protein V6Z12_A06G100900 [Gossypium hirsutum]